MHITWKLYAAQHKTITCFPLQAHRSSQAVTDCRARTFRIVQHLQSVTRRPLTATLLVSSSLSLPRPRPLPPPLSMPLIPLDVAAVVGRERRDLHVPSGDKDAGRSCKLRFTSPSLFKSTLRVPKTSQRCRKAARSPDCVQKTKAKVLKIIREQVLWSFLIPNKVRLKKQKKKSFHALQPH